MDMKEASAMTEASGLVSEQASDARPIESLSKDFAIRCAEPLRKVTRLFACMRSAKALSTPSVIIVIDICQAFSPLAAFQLCRPNCMFPPRSAIGKNSDAERVLKSVPRVVHP